jgi:cobalamin biosynthesis Mg chelatase CobN
MLQSFIAWCKGIFDWFKEKFWKFTTALFPWMILPQIEQALVTMDAKDIEAKVDEYTDKLGDKVLRFADKLSPITDKLAPILQRKVDVHLDIDTGKEKNTQSAAESVIQSAANVNKSANNNKQSTEPIVNTQAESASNANLSVNTASQSVANSKNSVAEPAKPTTLPVTKSAANTTNQPAESAANTAKTAAEAIKGGAQTILNTAAFATAATATTTQTSPLLTYLTVGTIILVIVSGIYVFSSRIKQAHHDNEKPGSKGKNDTPPEPTDV